MNNYANAQNLASYGRGNDTELIHMTPGEIKGLQAIALAHGGSLTINPSTGLPEAGFLERILPMVAGAGLMMIPGVGPLAAAAMVGGGYGLATGSIEKGLMAGLGAYGGAGLTSSLASLGSEAGRTAAEGLATEGYKTAADTAIKSGLENQVMDASRGMVEPNITEIAQNYITAQNFPGLAPETLQATQAAVPDLIKGGAAPENIMASLGRASATQAAPAGVTGSNVAAGLKEVGTNLPAAGQFASSNIGTLASAALPLLAADQQAAGPAGYQEDEYDRRLKGYRLSPDYQAYVAPRPNPYYRPTYAAEGGVMSSFDDEAGSDTVGMASGGIARYASKGQVNVLQDYLDRQEKEESKQKHLSTNPSSYFPDVGIFRDTDVDTARKDALTASMIRLGKAGKAAGIKARALPKTSVKGLGDVSGATPEIEEAADGGIMRYNLGGYSDGGRMLKGPGDGMSDSIPASIAGKQPARLADGEFVVPADVVSHLGNGSTDAGAKKLYGMMDKIRKARTGRKKQAPEINVDKFLPGRKKESTKKKASGGTAVYAKGGVLGYEDGDIVGYADGGAVGGIAGYAGGGDVARYASGGEINAAYEAILGRPADAAGAAYWASTGLSASQIADAIRSSPEATVKQVFQEQLGRAPDTGGATYYQQQIEKGRTAAEIAAEINRSLEGVNFDTQAIESAYNRNLGRTAEQEGFQYWLSAAQATPKTQKQLMDAIVAAAEAREKVDRGIQGKTFTELEVADFVADPFGGRRATTNIYDIPANEADRINISYINGIPVQFVSPVTERALISRFGEGAFKAAMGEETYSPDRVAETADRAFRAGSMTQAEYDRVMTGLDGISKDIQAGKLDGAAAGDNIRQLLNVPKGFKIIDPKYGQQIGEDNALDLALAEAAKRQEVLAAQDPGYYQANDILGQAYLNAGLDFPFMASDYKANTMMTQADRLTAQNAPIKLGQTTNQLGRLGPYNPNMGSKYSPEYGAQGKTPLPASVRDPYSDEGLVFLYGQMMDQYGTRDPSRVNPAIAVPNAPPVPYQPPPPGNLALQTPISDAARPAPAPAPDASGFFTAPGGQIFASEAAYNASVAPAPAQAKAGGLMAIDRKKRVKTKAKRGLLAA